MTLQSLARACKRAKCFTCISRLHEYLFKVFSTMKHSLSLSFCCLICEVTKTLWLQEFYSELVIWQCWAISLQFLYKLATKQFPISVQFSKQLSAWLRNDLSDTAYEQAKQITKIYKIKQHSNKVTLILVLNGNVHAKVNVQGVTGSNSALISSVLVWYIYPRLPRKAYCLRLFSKSFR